MRQHRLPSAVFLAALAVLQYGADYAPPPPLVAPNRVVISVPTTTPELVAEQQEERPRPELDMPGVLVTALPGP